MLSHVRVFFFILFLYLFTSIFTFYILFFDTLYCFTFYFPIFFLKKKPKKNYFSDIFEIVLLFCAFFFLQVF